MADYHNYNVAPSLKQAMAQRKHMAYYSLDSAIRAAESYVSSFHKGTVIWGARYEGSKTILDRVRTVKANPSAKPSLIGDITESFVPLDLMERTAQGAFSDVSRLSHTARGRKRRNPPDAVVHVVKAGRGKYVVRGIEVANCGSHCPALPNPNVIFKSLAKVKTWAKGLFKGDRHNRKVELVLQD